jgi:hypothetical protein
MQSHSARLVALVVGLAVAAAATPADAKKKRRQQNTGGVTVEQPKAATPREGGTTLYPPGPVYHANEYLGDDPDPFIRSQLQRDLGAHYGPPD